MLTTFQLLPHQGCFARYVEVRELDGQHSRRLIGSRHRHYDRRHHHTHHIGTPCMIDYIHQNAIHCSNIKVRPLKDGKDVRAMRYNGTR